MAGGCIDNARRDFDFSLWAYVFMPEHVHLLIHPKRSDYEIRAVLKAMKRPVGMRAIKYLQRHSPAWLSRISVSSGDRVERRFWQAGGGFDRGSVDALVIMKMIDYIHANPVRRQLVEKAEDWKWSSAGWRDGKNSLKPDVVEVGGLTGYCGGRE